MRQVRERAQIAGVCLVAAILVSPGLASAADTGMAAFYVGTLQIEVPNPIDPYFAQRQFSADHTYVDLEDGKLFHGAWAIKDGKICTTRDGGGKTFCNVGNGRAIGEDWTDKDPYSGNEVDFTLVAERKPLG